MKGEISLKFILISIIIILVVYAVLLFYYCYKNGRFLKTLLLSAASGLSAFAAVNLLSGVTGVGIAVNVWTALVSAFFGIPGVLGLLLIRLFF